MKTHIALLMWLLSSTKGSDGSHKDGYGTPHDPTGQNRPEPRVAVMEAPTRLPNGSSPRRPRRKSPLRRRSGGADRLAEESPTATPVPSRRQVGEPGHAHRPAASRPTPTLSDAGA